MRAVAAVLVIGAFVGGCQYVNKQMGLEDDHILEEALEHQIKENTGVDIDLSPESPEN